MKHSPGFLKIAEAARKDIQEIDAATLQAWLNEGRSFHLIDVREDHEWAGGSLPGAEHLGRGILERDIESKIPEAKETIVLYCGGGYRSALAARNLQEMGYTAVWSLAGGYRGWLDKGLPLESPKKV